MEGEVEDRSDSVMGGLMCNWNGIEIYFVRHAVVEDWLRLMRRLWIELWRIDSG